MPNLLTRITPALTVGLALSLLASACDAGSDSDDYLGTWDAVMLTPQGEVIALANSGIGFRDGEVCFVRFNEECHAASYAEVGDVTAVNMNGDPTYFLLYVPSKDYLVVREMSDRPILYIRREE